MPILCCFLLGMLSVFVVIFIEIIDDLQGVSKMNLIMIISLSDTEWVN